MTVASLQQLVEDYVLKRLTLANVLDLQDFCREAGMMLPASSNMQHRCQEFVAATFSALADMHGVERLRSSLPQDMLEILLAEMQKTQHDIRRLHLTGRVLERRPAIGGSCQSECSTLLPVMAASAGPVLSSHHLKHHKPCVNLKCAKEPRALSVTQRHANAVPLTGLAMPSAQPDLQNARQPDTDSTALRIARHTVSSRHVYPLSVLMAGMQWPADVDPAHRDQYLSNDEFEAVFGMTRAAFGELPQWKGRQLKIEHGLW